MILGIIHTFSLSRMWKKARRSIDSFPEDLYNGGKTRCPFVQDSDIVKRKNMKATVEGCYSRSMESF